MSNSKSRITPKAGNRDRVITVRLTDEELEQFDAIASVMGGRSRAFRAMLHEGAAEIGRTSERRRERQRQRDTVLLDALTVTTEAFDANTMQVRKIGVNFNQVVKSARARGKITDVNIIELIALTKENNELMRQFAHALAELRKEA